MENIAVGIDFTEAKGPVLAASAELAKATGAKLHVIHVIAPEPAFMGYPAYAYPGVDERQEELEKEQSMLQDIIDTLRAQGLDAHGYMKPGETVKSLLEFAEERDASTIIVGSHSRNFLGRLLLGSSAEGILRHSNIPVLVVPVRETKGA